MHDFLFYGLAGLLVLSSLLVVILPNLLHGAISLIGSFFVTAALYILLQMEFVALAQIMVYIGGIVVFILIIILLTTRLGEESLAPGPGQKVWGLAISGALGGLIFYLVIDSIQPENVAMQADEEAGGLEQIGLRLLDTTSDGFIVPFEIVSVLLFISLVGAVVIARKDK